LEENLKADLALFSGVLRRAWKLSDFMKTLLIGSLSSVVEMVKRHMRPISMIYVYTSGSGMAVEVRFLLELAFLCLTHGSIDVEDCKAQHDAAGCLQDWAPLVSTSQRTEGKALHSISSILTAILELKSSDACYFECLKGVAFHCLELPVIQISA
jgi:hypothetical protein